MGDGGGGWRSCDRPRNNLSFLFVQDKTKMSPQLAAKYSTPPATAPCQAPSPGALIVYSGNFGFCFARITLVSSAGFLAVDPGPARSRHGAVEVSAFHAACRMPHAAITAGHKLRAPENPESGRRESSMTSYRAYVEDPQIARALQCYLRRKSVDCVSW